MSWEAAGVIVALVVGLGGLILGALSLRRAGDANDIAAHAGTSSRQAVEQAQTANTIARQAIEHSRRSADAAERAVAIGDEANLLQRQGLGLEEARNRAALSANLDVRFLVAHEATKRFVFHIANKGPQEAKKVNVIYRDGNHEEELVRSSDLPPGQALTPECTLGGLYGAGRITVSQDGRVIPVPLGTQEGALHIAYWDGNGSRVLKKRVVWSDAPFFSERNISVEDMPDQLARIIHE